MSLKFNIIPFCLLIILGQNLCRSHHPDLVKMSLRQMKERSKKIELMKKQIYHHDHQVHECDHDNFLKGKEIISFELEPSPIEATLNHEIELRKSHQAGNWKNIRVLADYSNVETSPENLIFIQNKIMKPALGFISKAYRVYPKNSINETINQPICDRYIIPEAHFKYGVIDQDLVFYVSVENAKGQNWFVKSGPCILDRQTNRPVAGYILFNSDQLQTVNHLQIDKKQMTELTDSKLQALIQSTIHQITHTLGFSSYLFDFFISPQDNKKLGISNVATYGGGRSQIILRSVLTHTQSYFNCFTSTGALLENHDEDQKIGSHWERTQFGYEAMTASPISGNVFSTFTYKLLEGSGWYLPDYDFVKPYTWGINEGCEIASGSCPVDSKEFCDSTSSQCSFDYMGPAYCNSDDLSDGCKYWSEFMDFDCRGNNDFTVKLSTQTGGQVGESARCWATSLPDVVGYSLTTSCYKSQCIKKDSQIQFSVGTTNYICMSDGQVINVKFGSIQGTVTCPSISRFCLYENKCPKECSEKGICRDAKCECYAGFTGIDCSEQL